MPRFYFHVSDGFEFRDQDGMELDDLTAARHEAVRYAGQLLLSEPAKFWVSEQRTMSVTDERGLILFTITFLASDAAAIAPRISLGEAGKSPLAKLIGNYRGVVETTGSNKHFSSFRE